MFSNFYTSMLRMKLIGEKEQHRAASSRAQTTHNSSAAPPYGLYVSLVFDNYSLSGLCNDCNSVFFLLQ